MKERKEDLPVSDSAAWTLLNAEANSVILIDLNGAILFLNDSAARRFGRSAENILGDYLWDVYPGTSRSHHKIIVNQVVQTGQPITITHKEKELWSQTLFYPILGKDHQVETIALYTSDVTSQVSAEERLKQVLLELVTAQEDERHRISQDLHDDVGQKMTALVFELRAMKDAIEKNQNVSLKEIDAVIHNMELIIKHVRQIFYHLYPPSLTRMALPKVLEGFCSTFEETNHVRIDFSCQEEIPELPGNYIAAIYRFVQEGLTNVVKHSNASSVWINLDYIENDLNISLEDNGVGFDLNQRPEGIGLHGIRERFNMLGGGIEKESAPGKGTRLSGSIPFKNSKL
jgi:PAS domain S-box-containing protein